MAKKEAPRPWGRLLTAALLIFLLLGFTFFATLFITLFFGGEVPIDGNVAVVPIRGVLQVDRAKGFGTGAVASSSDIVGLIKSANEATNIKAILIDINSPGGSPLASQEIADEIKRSNKTVVAVIRETGASGAYWVASSADVIFASKNSLVGSIGVIGSYVEYAGLMDRFNLTYRRLVSGDFKDAGTPFKKLTRQEEHLIQSKIDKLYDNFVTEVASNRNMSKDKVLKLADGFILLGDEAKDAGLVDELGGRYEAEDYIARKLNITVETTEYKKVSSLSDLLAGVFSQASYYAGMGAAQGLMDTQMDSSFKISS